jgi:sulfate adenylyltransferase subunit 1 (EFTu-like GTPase family)
LKNLSVKNLLAQVVLKEAEKLVPQQPIGLKALLRAVETHVADIEDIVDMATHPEEFDLQTPVPDIAQVYSYLHEGVSCEEMLAIVKAGELPALGLPETQWPMMQIIDKLGHIATVSEVIVEETARGKS